MLATKHPMANNSPGLVFLTGAKLPQFVLETRISSSSQPV